MDLKDNEMQTKQSGMKAIYTIILVIVTAICIIIGIATRYYRGFSKIGKTVENTVDVEAFSDMNIDVSLGDFDIVYGDAYSVSYIYPEKMLPKVSVENKVLTVTQKAKNVRWGLGDFKNENYKLTITVPRNTEFKNCAMQVDMGTVKLVDFTSDNLDIKANMGDIQIKDSKINKLTVAADMGSIEMKNVEVEFGDFDADMGSIEGKDLIAKKINCDADMGSVELEGNIDEVKAECNMGSIEIDSDKAIDEMKLDLKCDMGDISVNGKSQGNKFHN